MWKMFSLQISSDLIEQIIPEWKYENPCQNRWEEFDDGGNVHAAVECWTGCENRSSCFMDAIRYERSAKPVNDRGINEASDGRPIVGIRGGYTVGERRQIHASLDVSGVDFNTLKAF